MPGGNHNNGKGRAMSENGADTFGIEKAAKNLARIILMDLSKALAWLAAGILTLSDVLQGGAEDLES